MSELTGAPAPRLVIRAHGLHESDTKVFRVAQLPCSIGRGPENDVVLDDSSVSARHAVLESRPGGLFVIDQHSTNGVVIEGALRAEAQVGHGTRLHLGAIELELHMPSEALEKTRAFSVLRDPGRGPAVSDHPMVLPALIVLSVALTHFDATVLNAVDRERLAWMPVAATFVACVAISCVISLFVKLVTREFRFRSVLLVMIAVETAGTVLYAITDFVGANLDPGSPLQALLALTRLGFEVGAVYAFGRVFTRTMTRRSLALVSVGLVSIGAALYSTSDYLWATRLRGNIAYPVRRYTRSSYAPDSLSKALEASGSRITSEIEKHPPR